MLESLVLWAVGVAKAGCFVDLRHGKRFAIMMANKASRPADSIPHANDTPVATKAAYEFLNNPRVETRMIGEERTGILLDIGERGQDGFRCVSMKGESLVRRGD